MPLILPTMADNPPKRVNIKLIFGEIIIIKLRGPNFCRVIKISVLFQDSPSIIAGNQK